MKLKTFLLAAVLFMILIQTVMITYYGIDKLSRNIEENEKENLMRISYDFFKRIVFFEELKAPIDYFIKNPEVRVKIILENKYQLKFLCDWFIKTAELNSLAVSNFEKKTLYAYGNKSSLDFLKKIQSSGIAQQSIFFYEKKIFAAYGCPIYDGKKIMGYISSFKEISEKAISNFTELNNISITRIFENENPAAGNLNHIIEVTDINGISGKFSISRDLSSSSTILSKMKRNFILISVGITVFVYLIGFVLVFKLTASLKRLENCAARMSAGDFDLKINKSRIREVNSLIESFKRMSADLKKSQDYIIRQEKLYLAGKLASGIAHELNNPLVAALGYTQMLIEKCGKDEGENIKYLKNIEKNIIRGRSIVKSLLNYSSKKNVCKFESSIRLIIEECIQLVKYQSEKKKTEIEFNCPGNSVLVTDKELLKQVIINIILNSIDAFPPIGGKILIKYEFINNKHILKISDNGPGIDKIDMPHIFEPFYSTKKEGEGSGLGLFLCYSYMKLLDGEIEIENNPANSGLTVRLIL